MPEVALGYDQQGSYVLVVDDKNVVERRAVKMGTKVEDRRVIEEGLTGDEWVIINGQLQAIPGKPVTPVKEGQPAGSGRQRRPASGQAGSEPQMISGFFIERPILANVLAFVTIIIGMVCFYACRWRSIRPSCRPRSR